MGLAAYGYDTLTGQKITTTTYDGSRESGTNNFVYDDEGRLVQVKSAGSVIAGYGYNENGSLKQVVRYRPDTGAPVATSTYEYDAKNQLKWINHASASTTNGNLASAGRFYYTVDDSGKRMGIHDGNQTTGNASGVTPSATGTVYTYDLAGRLETESIPAVGTANPAKLVKYYYDKVGNRTKREETLSGATTTTLYKYARTGSDIPTSNTQVPDVGRYGTGSGSSAWNAYAAGYTTNDWLWREERYSASNALTGYTIYDYDANGAMVRESQFDGSNIWLKRSDLSFTFDGKLSAQVMFNPGNLMLATHRVYYNYDGDGNRIGMDRQTLGTVGMGYGVTGVEHHQYLVDTSQPYAEVIQEAEWVNNALPLITRYDIGLDRLRMFKYQVTSNGPPPVYSPVLSAWYLFDGLGSTRALVDDSGIGTDLWGYQDAFGIPYRLYPATGGTTNPFFLNGQQWDGAGVWNSGEGLYFNRARYYQAGLGRFLGKDLYSGVNYEPVTLHRYLYGANDSVNNVDPTGNSFIGAIGAAFADLSAVIRDTGRVAIGGASIQHTLRYLAVRGFFWFSSHAIAPLIVEGSVAIGATATANAINWMLDRMANSMLNDGNPDNLFFNEDSEKEHVGGGWKDQGALHEDNFDEGPDDFKNIAKHYDKVDRIVSIGPKNKLFASLGTSWDYSEANLLSKIEAKVRAMSEPQYKIKKDSKHLISDDLPEFQKPQSGDVKAHIHGIPEDGIGILKSRTFIWKLMDLQRQYKVNIRITPIRGWVRGPLR